MAPTKMTHIAMNNSCVIPLNDIDKEIGDRHNIWGHNVTEAYTLHMLQNDRVFDSKELM